MCSCFLFEFVLLGVAHVAVVFARFCLLLPLFLFAFAYVCPGSHRFLIVFAVGFTGYCLCAFPLLVAALFLRVDAFVSPCVCL